MAVFEIEIVNWEKYNPRVDQKKHHWFRLNTDIFTDDKVQRLKAAEFKIWLWLMAERTRKGTPSIQVDPKLMSRWIRLKPALITSSIRRIAVIGLLSIRDEYDLDTSSNQRIKRPKGSRAKSGKICALRNDTIRNDTVHNDTNTESEKKSVTYSPAKEKSPDELIAEQWLEYAKKEMPWSEPPDGWTVENFAKDIAKVRAATNLNEQGISEVLKFVSYDEFWRDKALSPGGLLKRSDRNGQRKIDNILLRMKPKESKSDRVLREYAEDTTPLKETDGMPF